MSDLLFLSMVIWTVMLFTAMWLSPEAFKGQKGQHATVKRRLAAIVLTGAAIAFSIFLFFLIGEPWNAILSNTLLLISGAVALYHAWKHRQRQNRGRPRADSQVRP